MSIGPCIPELIAAGALPKGKAKDAQREYDRLLNIFDQQMGDDAARAMATSKVLEQLDVEFRQKKRRQLLQAGRQVGILADIASYDGGKGVRDGLIEPRAAEAIFAPDGKAGYQSVDELHRVVRGRAHAMLDSLLQRSRRTLAGRVRNPAEQEEIVRALFGEDTGNIAAREMAESWTAAAEMLRQRFNAAGGAIGKLDRWGLPQSHDSRAVRMAGFGPWRDFIWPLLDRSRMLDDRTGLPFDDDALDKVLRDVFDTIRSDGWSKREAGQAGRPSLANSRAEHRFLHFASADDWLNYNARFGQGSAFDAMISHVDGMSRDIALMEVLGPNPPATVRWIKDNLSRSAALVGDDAGKAVDAADAGAVRIQRLYDELTGDLSRPESRRVALAFSTLRSVQTSAKLGAATLSAVTDIGFQTFTRAYNGLPAARTVVDYVKLLRPGASEDRKLAVRMGLIAEEWSQRAASQHRYLNEELTGEVARRLAEFTLRASGLSHFTQSGRWAFGMQFVGHMTDESVKPFDALDPAFRRAMERYGIDAAGWDSIRATPLTMERGVPWLMPTAIEDERLGDKVLAMIQTETDFAVPMADVRTRAMFNAAAPRGNLLGEALRSTLLFKGFGISILLTHGRRFLEQQGLYNRAFYSIGFLTATTAMGGLALQLKETAKGKDPLPMGFDNEKDAGLFWGTAMLQGGGFGIFGDFLGASENRFGGGIGSTLAGPMAQTASNIGDLTIGNAMKAYRGDKTDAGKDAIKLLQQEVPVASSLWYTRLAYERIALDALRQQADPDYRDSWRRMERRAREQGQDYWWRPGETSPDRTPDFSNMIEGERP